MAGQILHASKDEGEVYVIRCEDYVKIGWSKTVKRRFNQISSCNPFPCELLGSTPGTVGDEGVLHLLLDTPRVKGEWFGRTLLVKEVVRHLLKAEHASETCEWLSEKMDKQRAAVRAKHAQLRGESDG